MKAGRTALGLLALLALALPAAAQENVRLGETKRGSLAESDARLDDESFYDLYQYQGRSGETVQIVMQSADFDAYLAFGTMEGGEFAGLATDDDDGGGTDAKLVVTLPSDGVYVIRANSLTGGETGAYTLSVTRGDPADAETLGGAMGEADPLPDPTPIRIGQTMRGELSTSDVRMADRSFYDLYSFQASAGQYVIITMRSTDFDAYLSLGTVDGGSFSTLESDDDGAGEKDAQVEYQVEENGTYYIRANALFADSTGRYTLSVETGTPKPKPVMRVQPIQVGQTVRGSLSDEDPTMDDDSYFELWSFSGNAGDQFTITLRSEDFDAYLGFGQMEEGEFSQIESNDDDGGGTDAQLTVTLERTGEYVIRANTLTGGESGDYSLSLVRGGSAPGPTKRPAPEPVPVRIGQTVQGELTTDDPTADDDSHFDLYSVSGAAGTPVVITLESSDFDAYLLFGRMADGEWQELESDDDGGGGTNSRIEVRLGDDGTYLIRANTLSAGETGSYTLKVVRGGGQ